MTLSAATTVLMNRPRINGNEGIVFIPQKLRHYWSLTIGLTSVTPRSFGKGGSYLSAEMQSVYSTAPIVF